MPRLRCSKGDQAWVHHSENGNYGVVLTCLELAGELSDRFREGVYWKVDTPIRFSDGNFYYYAMDAWLTPFKPLPPEEETTEERHIKRPVKEKEPA